MKREKMFIAILTAFLATLTVVIQVFSSSVITYPLNLVISVITVGVVALILTLAFATETVRRSRRFANFYRRPLTLVIFYSIVQILALYALYNSAYVYGLDALLTKNSQNVTQILHVSITASQLNFFLGFSIMEAGVSAFAFTILIGVSLYRFGIERQKVEKMR